MEEDHNGEERQVVDAFTTIKSKGIDTCICVVRINRAFYDPHGEAIISPDEMRWMDDCCVDINPLGDNSGGTQSIVIGDTTIPLYYNSMTTIWYNTRPKSAHLSLKRFTLTSPVFFRPFDLVITLSVS